MSSRQLGFVGLGRMGGPMSARLLAAGHHLTVFDTSTEALRRAEAQGAAVAASPREVGDRADVVLVSLPTPDIVHSVVLGTDGVAEGGQVKTVIALSTSGPSAAGRIAAGLAQRGRQWIDAPVSGGGMGAAALFEID